MISPAGPAAGYLAAGSSLLAGALTGPDQAGRWLGGSAPALYLELADGAVIAVLTADAVRLPCAVLLPWRSDERPLTDLAPPDLAGHHRATSHRGPTGHAGTPLAGQGRITWTGRDGPVTIRIVRYWRPARISAGHPADRGALRGLAASLAGTWEGLGLAATPGGGPASEVAVRELLGRGTGLTPAGDDLLAGYLLGLRAFRKPGTGPPSGQPLGLGAFREPEAGPPGHRPAPVPPASGVGDELGRLINELAPGRTTALSARLLGYAADGYCADQVAALAGALAGAGPVTPAARRLLAVGHTSGAALAWGLLLAGQSDKPEKWRLS